MATSPPSGATAGMVSGLAGLAPLPFGSPTALDLRSVLVSHSRLGLGVVGVHTGDAGEGLEA
jgi:hypothetical protein